MLENDQLIALTQTNNPKNHHLACAYDMDVWMCGKVMTE